ncbi:MAG: glycosyltransferase [Actinobacteria bacterium]|uniref:Unannotated protein n=1 Tax=freshwater metagenome TaxID=449393 RepID=A0A6J6W630_9ZZZZ|nr:glycosyltransferase [Actinomycetota bacterium]
MSTLDGLNRDNLAGRQIVIEGSYLLKPAFGIHKLVAGIIDWLADLSAEVTVLMPGTPPESLVRRDGVRYVGLPVWRAGRGLAYEQYSIPKYLKTSSAEVFLAPGNRGVPVVGVRQRTVLIVHDMIPFQGRTGKGVIGYLGLAPNRFSIRSSIRRATRVVTVSASAQSDLLEQQHRESIVGYVPLSYLGFQLHRGTTPDPFFLFTGGVSPRKNLGPTLDAFATFRRTHPEFELRITGTSDVGAFTNRFGLGQLPQGVVLTGRLSNEALLEMVRRSSALVYPSAYEGKGLPIIEALATGRPIICGTGGSQTEVAGPAGIFVNPITSETIHDAMESALLVDLDEYEKIATSQYRKVDGPEWEQGLLQALFA